MAIPNRRRTLRRRIRVLTAVVPGNIQTVAEDVSDDGLFLRTSRVRPPGETVTLLWNGPAGELRGTGVVRWARRVPVNLRHHFRGGMGIHLTEMSEDLRAFLRPQET